MTGRVVYEFPAEFPFRVQLVAVAPGDRITGNDPPWQLVRQGLYLGHILLGDITREDLVRLSHAVTEELARS
jgi:hypothetical protein